MRKSKITCLILACVMTVLGGCGQEQAEVLPDAVDLLEPVGVAYNYETAVRRNLYNAKIYSGLVCPYVEEYHLDENISFRAYDAYPGDRVKRGSTLLHADSENIDRQIEAMEESIAQMEEDYQEFLKENDENLKQPRSNMEYYDTVLKNWEKQKPEESSPEYTGWYNEYHRCEGIYSNALQNVLELEEARKERTELYELDHAYNLLRLKRLKEERSSGTLVSGMEGYVGGSQLWYSGQWFGSGQPLMAVCDTTKIDIKSNFVTKTDINNADDVYAIVNGKRYEVEYEPMDKEEYERLRARDGTVYTTFHVVTDADELEMGSYAVIVVKNQTRENVVTVPKDAVKSDGSVKYVYLVNGDESVYTVVSTGVTDGMYTEILSGVQEGDKVMTDQALTAGEETFTVTKGSMENTFSGSGYFRYLSSEAVVNPVKYGTCYLVEICAYEYQQVKAGDVLARIRVVPDQVAIERNEQRLVRLKERLEELKKENPEGNEKLIAQREDEIRELEELISDMKSDAAVTEIKAPRNGIILSVSYMEEGSRFGNGERICYLADESRCYVYVDDPDGQLAYGNTAEVGYKEGIYQRQTTGDVVSLNKMALSGSLRVSGALIKVPPDDLGTMAGSTVTAQGYWIRNPFRVTVSIRVMKDVLLVPRRAVTESGGRTYVKVRLESGEIQYRSFIAGGSDASNYWVVEGLTEGMEICL